MPTPYTEIHLFLAAENNKEAKFLFAKKEIVVPDLQLYERWIAVAELKQASDIALLNRILRDKEKAIAEENYIWASTYRASELNAVYQLTKIHGMVHNKIAAQRDFNNVRCYLLLKIMEKNDLHEGFEKMN